MRQSNFTAPPHCVDHAIDAQLASVDGEANALASWRPCPRPAVEHGRALLHRELRRTAAATRGAAPRRGSTRPLNWAVPLRVAPRPFATASRSTCPSESWRTCRRSRRLRESGCRTSTSKGADVADRPLRRSRAPGATAVHCARAVAVLRRGAQALFGVSRADGVGGTRRLSDALRVA